MALDHVVGWSAAKTAAGAAILYYLFSERAALWWLVACGLFYALAALNGVIRLERATSAAAEDRVDPHL
jgi:hypothetical protein